MLVAYRSKNRAVGYEYTERDQQQKTGHFETCNQELSPSYTSNAFPSDLDTTYPCAFIKHLASIRCYPVATGGEGTSCDPNPPSQATISLRVFVRNIQLSLALGTLNHLCARIEGKRADNPSLCIVKLFHHGLVCYPFKPRKYPFASGCPKN